MDLGVSHVPGKGYFRMHTILQIAQSFPESGDPRVNEPRARVSAVWKCRKWEVSRYIAIPFDRFSTVLTRA